MTIPTTAYDTGPALVALAWPVGDDWTSDEWAVLIDGAPVNLAEPGWVAHGQVRSRSTDTVLASWSSATTDPDVGGLVLLRTAQIPLSDGSFVTTSTLRLRHGAEVSQGWGPVVGEVEVEITRRPDPAGPPTRNRTVVKGTVRSPGDGSR